MSGFAVPAPYLFNNYQLIMKDFAVTHHRHLWQALSLLIIDIIFFTKTNANRVAPVVLIVGFVLLVLTLYQAIYALLSAARLYGLPVRYKHRLALYLCVVLSLMAALQSIGALTPKDILILLPLATLGYLYGMYMTTHRRNLDS